MVLMRITGVTAVSVLLNSEVSHALLGLKQVTARARYETKTDLELQKKREELQQGGDRVARSRVSLEEDEGKR